MSEKIKDGEVIPVKGKGKWRSKFVCRECRGTRWKTVAKGKEFRCLKCGKTNTGVLFIWDAKKKGLIVWIPPPPEVKPPKQTVADPNQQVGVKAEESIGENQQVSVQGVELHGGVEPDLGVLGGTEAKG